MIGQLWCSLADYYIRGGHFEKVSIRLLYFCVMIYHMRKCICLCLCLCECVYTKLMFIYETECVYMLLYDISSLYSPCLTIG